MSMDEFMQYLKDWGNLHKIILHNSVTNRPILSR